MNVSEYLVCFLEKKGIDHIFGVVGGASLWICKAFNQAEHITSVFTNHEQAAAMAADGWARVSGKPGVVFTINGPGMTNTITGIAQAWVDSSPIILISGNSNLSSVRFERENNLRQYGTQDVRADLLMSPITKKTYIVDDPNNIATILNDAYETAMSGRPGPVFIEIPINIQSAKVDLELSEKRVSVSDGWVEEEQEDIFENIIDLLTKAERPLVLAGQGVRLSQSVSLFREFVQKFDVPVVNSRMGIDTIESDSKYYVGRCGNHGSRPAHFAIETCDVMLILGCRMAPNVTGYDYEKFSSKSYKILIDIDENELNKRIKIDQYVHADVFRFLNYANDKYKKTIPHSNSRWVELCNTWKKKYPIMQKAYYCDETISTYRVVEEVSNMAGNDDLIISDTGSCCCIVAQTWNVKANQRVFISGGLSAMGYWTSAMGLAIAKKDHSQVICFVGDGSLQMNIQEFATLSLYKIPVKMIVISNRGYQFVRMSQSSYGITPPYGTDPETGVPIPIIENIVKAYGIKYISCHAASALKDRIQELFDTGDVPCILEIFVDDNQEVQPRIKSIARDDGSFEAPNYANLYPFLDPDELKKEMEKAF